MDKSTKRNLIDFLVVGGCVGLIALIVVGTVVESKSNVVLEKEVVKVVKEVVVKEVNIPVYIRPEPQPIGSKALGEFEITYYTAGKESTGKSVGHPQYGITSSGATVWKGVTVAVDPKVIPAGSYLYIEGIGFRVALDTGGAIKGKDIDVYVPNVKVARQLGRHKANVYLLSEVAE